MAVEQEAAGGNRTRSAPVDKAGLGTTLGGFALILARKPRPFPIRLPAADKVVTFSPNKAAITRRSATAAAAARPVKAIS